jgi:predicted permease
MDSLFNDLRYSLRRLLRAPVFALVAIATLALGIGANTAIFSFVNAVLFKPPGAVQDPEHIVQIFTSDFSGPLYSSSSYPDFEDFRKETNLFSRVAAIAGSPINLVRGQQVERLSAEIVTADYFNLVGVQPVAGRLLQVSDSSEHALVLSANAWQTRFGRAQDIIGATVTVNGNSYTVVGVAEEKFNGLRTGVRSDAWVPMESAGQILAGAPPRNERDSRGIAVFARLQPGVTVEAAQSRMRVLQQQLFQAYPEQWRDVTGKSRMLTVLSEKDARVPPDNRGTMFTLAGVLLGAVAFVLLICCANVANLLLARAAGREREIAIRYSLGARRVVVLRQLIMESMVLALAGGAAGLLLALWTTDLLVGWRPAGAQAPYFDVSPDLRVLAFTSIVSLCTGLLFGFAPGLQTSRTRLLDMLKSERAISGSARQGRLRDILVGGQIAVALVLAVTAGLLARTLAKASQVDAGFNPRGVVVAFVDLETAGYNPERAREFYRAFETNLAGKPGVEATTLATRIPLANPGGRRGIRIPDYTPQQGEDMEFPFNVVGAHYFEVMDVGIVRGRAFTEADRVDAPPVVIVNETFAKRFWPGQDPIGKRFSSGRADMEVIGVARDGKYWTITESPRPYFYLPYEQSFTGMQLHVRYRGDETAVKETMRRAIQSIDPMIPILMLDSMEGQMGQAVLPQRIAGVLVGFFALLAILLASIGVYGVTSVVVAQRVPELGLRVALGATSREIVRLIVGRALFVAAGGIGVGLLVSALATRGLRSFLYGVSTLDPLSFGIAAVVLGLAAALAGLLPALRATRVDPLVALKG